jgi:hypothetical protein
VPSTSAHFEFCKSLPVVAATVALTAATAKTVVVSSSSKPTDKSVLKVGLEASR